MISGTLLIDPNKQDSLKAFFTKRMPRIIIPTLFWSFFYLAYTYRTRGLTASSAIDLIAQGTPYYHLWYLYMVIGLYSVLIPIRILCINSDRQILIVTLCVSFLMQFIYFLERVHLIVMGIHPNRHFLYIHFCHIYRILF